MSDTTRTGQGASGNGRVAVRPADGTVAGGEVEVECPGCGLLLVGNSPRPTAAWFCPRCDFPVFWASGSPDPAPAQRRARRRLPGTAGRDTLGAAPCWHCGEQNEPGSKTCIRCAASLPKPAAPAPEPVVVERDRLVPAPYAVPSRAWPFVTAAVLGTAAVTISATLWVLHLAGMLSATGALP